ncbi:response regulator [Cohnella hongkongensis]|uniref:Response regulator n=1 Tax=Cohnella hongkongensis TaxID=178337 RepID=A0ABV9F8Z8_9BACL
MKAILVDDEPLALRSLRRALNKEMEELEIVAEYSDPEEAVSGAAELGPDVAFLDIQMPGTDGLRLGERIQAVLPNIEIVFVTGYDQYAVKAFELYALDYILKPVNSERLRRTLERVREKLTAARARQPQSANVPFIRCLGQLRFQLPGSLEQFPKWRTSKAQELFAYLLHHRDRTVGRSDLLELLWPEVEQTKAAQHLYTAIYHIRQTLKACRMDGTVSVRMGELETGYRLDIGAACVDVEIWERRMTELGALDESTAADYERQLEAYTGDYLAPHGYLWAEHEREHLRMLWLHQMNKLAVFYEGSNQREKAVEIRRRIQRRCPEQEDSYFALMKLYDALGDQRGVEVQYWMLKEWVEKELDLSISDEIVRWYERWRAVGKK